MSKVNESKTIQKSKVENNLEDDYNAWIIENIHIYELFKKFTLQAIASGATRVSHWLIVNRIRWETEVETLSLNSEERKYKITNNYISLLARDFIKDYPEHSNIFKLKMTSRY